MELFFFFGNKDGTVDSEPSYFAQGPTPGWWQRLGVLMSPSTVLVFIPLAVLCCNNKVLMELVEPHMSDFDVSLLLCCSFALLCTKSYNAAKLYWDTLLCCTSHAATCSPHYCFQVCAIAVPLIKGTFLHNLNSTHSLTSAQAPEYLSSHHSFSLLDHLMTVDSNTDILYDYYILFCYWVVS